MKCLYCQKDLPNPKARFCSQNEKMKYRRENNRNNKEVIIVTNNRNKDEIIVTKVETVTSEDRLSKLVFKKETPIKERIEFYKSLYPEHTFVPNWIVNGFLNKEEALKNAIASVNRNMSVSSTGLNI